MIESPDEDFNSIIVHVIIDVTPDTEHVPLIGYLVSIHDIFYMLEQRQLRHGLVPLVEDALAHYAIDLIHVNYLNPKDKDFVGLGEAMIPKPKQERKKKK